MRPVGSGSVYRLKNPTIMRWLLALKSQNFAIGADRVKNWYFSYGYPFQPFARLRRSWVSALTARSGNKLSDSNRQSFDHVELGSGGYDFIQMETHTSQKCAIFFDGSLLAAC